MVYTLTAYQLEALEIALSNFDEGKNTILALPPGTGKSVICSSLIKRITQRKKGRILLLVPTKIMEHQYQRLLQEQGIELSNVVIVASPNRERLNAVVSDIIAVIFEPLESFPTKIAEHVSILFECPQIVFTPFINPPEEMIQFFKKTNIDFKFSLNEVIEYKILDRLKETGSQEFARLYREFEDLGLKGETSIIKDIIVNIKKYESSLSDLSDTVKYLLDSGIAKHELELLDFRKRQLKIFDRLLNDSKFYSEAGGTEKVWQKFFEENTWVFGYGLTFIFNEPLKEKKLEQVVSGYSIKERGKRTDALMKSRGVVSTLCFTEIKTHEKRLLKGVQYRDDSWPISDELSGGIAQLQKTIHLSLNNINFKLDLKNPDGFTDETIYLYRPKAYLIIGSLKEFTNETGLINESQHSSFELFRRSLDIEIITFDELYNRAKAIVDSTIKN